MIERDGGKEDGEGGRGGGGDDGEGGGEGEVVVEWHVDDSWMDVCVQHRHVFGPVVVCVRQKVGS